jgi:L-rhamnose isomerase
VESKVFGIGVEAYTVGSAEYALAYAAMNPKRCIPLMDNGHYHPTEVVSDKIPALLAFFPELALHITRPIRWDSDHVVLLDDETKEICKEIVRCGGLDGKVHMALDYFDASINRVAAWVLGMRNMQKELLKALLQPNAALKDMQDKGDFTSQLVWQEELKNYPVNDVWEEFCRRAKMPAGEEWLDAVKRYERDVLAKR